MAFATIVKVFNKLLPYRKKKKKVLSAVIYIYIYSLRHRKCGVRGYMHKLFVSKTRTSAVRASEGF